MNEEIEIYQENFLEQIQDEISSIVECLVLNYTGEAKSEISSLINKVASMSEIDSEYKNNIINALDASLHELRIENQSVKARSSLCKLRRHVYNTYRESIGKRPKYNF